MNVQGPDLVQKSSNQSTTRMETVTSQMFFFSSLTVTLMQVVHDMYSCSWRNYLVLQMKSV